MLSRRGLPARRLTRLDATRGFLHGLLALAGMLALAGPAPGQTPPVAPAPKPAQAAPAPTTAPGGILQVPATAKPAVPAPPRAPAAAVNAKTTIVIEVTNPRGLGIQDIRVELAGPVPRDATTDASGFVRFIGLRPGTYRARFSGEDVVTLEKEIVVAAGRTTETEATLTPAEPKPAPSPQPPPPPPPAPAAPVVGPAGTPQVVDLLARERLGKGQTRLETLLGCSGNTRSTLLQLAQDQPQRLYEGAEIVLYVVTGEAGITVGAKEGILGPGGFVSIPRSTAFTLRRRGNKTFEALVVLAGEPCERAQ